MLRCLLFTIIVVLAVGVLGFGGQLLVAVDGSASFRTIQGAIDAAGFGDTIVVKPGIYEEQLELKTGTTVRGSGAGATVVRFAYGYDPLVSARNVSQCVLENITLERAPSLLPAEVMVVANASVMLVRCNVSGGSVGIRVSGNAGRVVFAQGAIEKNLAQGMIAGDGTSVELREASVAANMGGGIAANNVAGLQLTDVVVSRNGSYGVSVTGATDATISGCTISSNDGPGMDLLDHTALELLDTRVATNRGPAMRLEDEATATCLQCEFEGGDGIVVSGSSRLELRESTFAQMSDTAISWLGSSSGWLDRVSIVDGAGTGVSLAGNACVTIERATIAGNEGAGVSVAGGTLELAQSMVVLNRRYGVELQQAGELLSISNNVWGNTPDDLSGAVLRPGDLSVPPSFVSLETGNVTLRPDSRCLLPTVPGGALGSIGDPRLSPGVYGGLAGVWTSVVDWSGGLGSMVRLAVEGGWHDESAGRTTLAGAVMWPSGEFGVEADRGAASGPAWSSWLRWDAAAQIGTIDSDEPADASVSWSADLQGRLSGAEKWILVDVAASLVVDPFSVDIGFFQTVPGGASLERIEVAVDLSQWRWRISMGMRDLAPVLGEVLLDADLASDWGRLAVDGSFQLFPSIGGQVGMAADLAWGSIGLGAAWGVEDPLQLYISASDAALGVDFAASWIQSQGNAESMRLVAEVGKSFPWGELGGRVVLGGGVRLEANGTIRLDALQMNRVPVPGFTVFGTQSDDPLTIWLDAAPSLDPDGGELSYEWSFGDGESASGVVVAHTFPTTGSYSVVLTVTDEEGAAAHISEMLEVGGSADTEITARFSWVAEDATGRRREGPPRIGDMLIVDASRSISDEEVSEFAWDVEGDGVIELRTEDPVAGLPLLNEGPIAIVLRITDTGGRTGAVSDVVDVAARAFPVAVAAFSPTSPLVNEPVEFTDLSTDPDGAVVAWAWSFGDGQSSDERHPRHAYADAGLYDVTLEVTDHEGLTGVTSLTIEVGSAKDVLVPADVWVLVIGISDYATVDDLQYAREDAVSIARWALSTGVPADHLRLLLDEQGRVEHVGGLSADTADLLHVREALGWLRREAGEEDLVIIAFSGHGARAEDDNGDEVDGWDELFLLRDTIAGAEAETAFRDDELAAFVGRIPSRRVVLLLDTCFSGGAEVGGRTVSDQRESDGVVAPEGGGDRDWDWADLATSSTVILAAAGEGQVARESEALEHGVFTHFFLEAVSGNADADEDARVTAAEAMQFIAPRVDAFVFSWLGVHQQPQLAGRGDPAIVLARMP